MNNLFARLDVWHDVLVNLMGGAGIISAFVVLVFMQNVTSDAGVRCKLAALQLAQRILYVALAAALFCNAIWLLADSVLPPLRDAFVEASFFALSIVSYIRHRGTPKLPRWANWHTGSPKVYFEAPKPNGQIHAQH